MDSKAIEADIKNYKIREGPLYKRSKFLKEWRERWIVLTSNYIYTFASKNLDEVTDIIDLKEIKSYKSYLRKDEEMIPPGFKVRSADDMYYFCAKNCNEKWSWLVSLERLMDYKYVGSSNYNNADWIKTKGFDSQTQFETGGAKVSAAQPSPLEKQKSSEEAKKNVDDEADQILKKLQEQQKELEKKKQQLDKKQATFLLEQKKAEQEKAKKQQQLKKQQQVKKQMPKKQEPKKEEAKKPEQKPEESPKKTATGDGPSVSQLRNMFQNKMTESKQTGPKYDTSKYQSKKVERKQDDIGIYRGKVVTSLFEQFRKQAAFTFGLKHVTDFLVNVCADQKSGYSSFVIIEGKTNPNRKNFSQVFIELLNVFNDYEKCENLMKFIEICIFSITGLFDAQQTAVVQRKLKDIFLHVNDQEKLALVIKNMFIMNKLCKYDKDKNDIAPKLDKLLKEAKKQECRNWAKKLRDQL